MFMYRWNLDKNRRFFIDKLKTKAQPKCVCTCHHFTEHLLLAFTDTQSVLKRCVQMKYFPFLCYLHTTAKKSRYFSLSCRQFHFHFFFLCFVLFASMSLNLCAEGVACHCSNFEIITHRELFWVFHCVFEEKRNKWSFSHLKPIQCVLFTQQTISITCFFFSTKWLDWLGISFILSLWNKNFTKYWSLLLSYLYEMHKNKFYFHVSVFGC